MLANSRSEFGFLAERSLITLENVRLDANSKSTKVLYRFGLV